MAIVAETSSGRVRGREEDGVLLFAGPPYAAPAGVRRFRAAALHDGWAAERAVWDGRR